MRLVRLAGLAGSAGLAGQMCPAGFSCWFGWTAGWSNPARSAGLAGSSSYNWEEELDA